MAAAALALMCFTERSMAAALMGFGMLAIAAVSVERIIHTTYVLTSDGRLLVSKGRFARIVDIGCSEVTSVRLVKRRLLLSSHVVIEYGDGKTVVVQPEAEERFVKEMRRRMDRCREGLQQ